MKNIFVVYLLLSFQFVFAQTKSEDAELLEEKYINYKVSEDGIDTKGRMKSMKKAINRIALARDTSAIDVLLDIYIGYDATDNDVKALAYVTLLKFKPELMSKLALRISQAELKYGIQRNIHLDYMDLLALKMKLEK
jgi:hypothetical protein